MERLVKKRKGKGGKGEVKRTTVSKSDMKLDTRRNGERRGKGVVPSIGATIIIICHTRVAPSSMSHGIQCCFRPDLWDGPRQSGLVAKVSKLIPCLFLRVPFLKSISRKVVLPLAPSMVLSWRSSCQFSLQHRSHKKKHILLLKPLKTH